MRTYLGWLLAAIALPLTAYAQEATVKEVHDTPAVRGSIIANLLQEHGLGGGGATRSEPDSGKDGLAA